MSHCERQTPETGRCCDKKIRAAEAEDIEILSPVVPGSRLHAVIHNPMDSGSHEA